MSKTVLVTGANTGIGYALCKLLATEHGCSVLLGSRTKSKGEKAVADIKKLAPNASVELVEIDVSSDESVAAAAAAVKAKGVTLYGLVNNAGVGLVEENARLKRLAEVALSARATETEDGEKRQKTTGVICAAERVRRISRRESLDLLVTRSPGQIVEARASCRAWTQQRHATNARQGRTALQQPPSPRKGLPQQ